MADSRKHISTHYVIRVVVEEVQTSGIVPYGDSVPLSTTIDRKVSEVGNAVTKDINLDRAIEKAKGHLDLMVED